MNLPPAPHYFPMRSGKYTVAPDLKPLGTDFGAGALDRTCFQFDERWPQFRAEKLAARSERLEKYTGEHQLTPETRRAVVFGMIETVVREHPTLFRFEDGTLLCELTSERLQFREDGALVGAEAGVHPRYVSALDALACQIQEDFAVVQADEQFGDHLAAIHVCLPSRWPPQEKLGLPFPAVHAPVPHFEKISAASRQMVRAMTERGPLVRFGWSVEVDDRLNHHPEPPPNADPEVWNSRTVKPGSAEPFFLRVERQVLMSFPKQRASVFLIRVHHTPASAILTDPDKRTALTSAIETMSSQTREYKGMTVMAEELLAVLRE